MGQVAHVPYERQTVSGPQNIIFTVNRGKSGQRRGFRTECTCTPQRPRTAGSALPRTAGRGPSSCFKGRVMGTISSPGRTSCHVVPGAATRSAAEAAHELRRLSQRRPRFTWKVVTPASTRLGGGPAPPRRTGCRECLWPWGPLRTAGIPTRRRPAPGG